MFTLKSYNWAGFFDKAGAYSSLKNSGTFNKYDLSATKFGLYSDSPKTSSFKAIHFFAKKLEIPIIGKTAKVVAVRMAIKSSEDGVDFDF